MGDIMLSNIERKIFKVEAIIIATALAIIFIAVTVQVLIRMLGMNSVGTTEIAMVSMSILTFIGTSATMYTKDHITIEITQLIKSQKLVYWVNVILTMLLLVFGIVFIRIVYTLLNFTLYSGDKTLELGIPLAIPIGSMVLGILLLIIHSICDLIKLYQTRNEKNVTQGMEE